MPAEYFSSLLTAGIFSLFNVFGDHTYTSYNNQAYCTPASAIQTPSSVEQVQAIVRSAIEAGQTVKAIGNLHSINDIACTEGIPIRMTNINYTRFDEEDDSVVTLGVGIELTDALAALSERNRSLIHVPTFGGISIGGALGAGAHGSSLLHPTSLSDQVLKVTIVDGLGNIHEISDPEELKAFRVHLGLLGILIDVTFPTVPLFKMTIHNTPHSDDILSNGTALKWAREHDTFSMWWFPSTSSVVASKGSYIMDPSVPGTAATFLIGNTNSVVLPLASSTIQILQNARSRVGLQSIQWFAEKSLYRQVIGKPQIYSQDNGHTLSNPATGFAWKLLQNKCTTCAWSFKSKSLYPEDFSISVSLDEFPKALETVKSILNEFGNHPYFYMVGVYLRFSKASDSYVATNSGQDIVDFEWISPSTRDPFNEPKYGLAVFQTIQQALVFKHKGRPHWGKNGLYYTSKDVLAQTLQNREKFLAVMKKYDPNRLFANKFALRLKGYSNEMNVNPKVKRCALQDYCVCSKDEDCAKSQECVEHIEGYFACKDSKNYQDASLNIPYYDPSNLTSILDALSYFSF